MNAPVAPILPTRPTGPWQVALDLWRARGSFRGFVEFAIIGAIVLAFLASPGKTSLGKLPQIPIGKQEDAGEGEFLGVKFKPMGVPGNDTPKQVWTAPRLNEIDLQASYFASEPEPLRSRLAGALATYWKHGFADALSMLDGEDRNNPKVLLMRGIAQIALRGDGDFKAGMAQLRKAAERGDRKAMAFLGIITVNGLPGLTSNVEEGRYWLGKAALAGETDALRVMGQSYATGWGGTVDPARAITYLRQASDLGDAQSTFRLAEMYFVGAGIKRDHQEAERLMSIAAKAGHVEAQALLGSWLLIPYGSGVNDDPSAALEWLDRAAEKLEPHAMHSLGMFYVDYGKRTNQQDPERGVAFFRRCAELTMHTECAFALATALENGIGTVRDLPQAYAFYSIARSGSRPGKSTTRIAELKQIMSPAELTQANAIVSQLRMQHSKRQKLPLNTPLLNCSFGSPKPC